MRLNTASAFLFLLLIVVSCSQELEWWKTTTFYQVYPRSFKDSNGDGIGDIKGITSKLDHFVETGIQGIWLSPIYKSPMKDFGYDISDFTAIDEIFGTMEDFEELVTECQKRGLKLVMDMVPNHSSNEHDWFVQSIARIDPYTDYYIWRNASGFNAMNIPQPPNNWLSVFGGSAWTWNEARQQFYYHQFHAGQPDLNFRNDRVLQEMKDIMNFWLEKGVDGFRMDAVPHLMEDPNLTDEPLSNDPGYTPDQWGYLDHIYTKDLPELYNIIFELRATMDITEQELQRPLVMMVEAYTDIEHTMMYYGNATHPGAHFPFNFQLISYLNNATRAQELEDIIKMWMDNMPEGEWANWVIGNHDQPRIASRLGRDFGIAAMILGQLLPGTAITYNGEEIGMENTYLTYEETLDPSGCQAGPEYYQKYSRDPSRTPYQWSAEKHAGFSPSTATADPWLPVNPNYETLNLEAQKIAADSVYKIYKDLTEVRNTTAIQIGALITKVLNNDTFAFAREVEDINVEKSVLVVVNTGHTVQTVDVRSVARIPDSIQYYTGSLDSGLESSESVPSWSVQVPARGGLVFMYSSAVTSAISIILLGFTIFIRLL